MIELLYKLKKGVFMKMKKINLFVICSLLLTLFISCKTNAEPSNPVWEKKGTLSQADLLDILIPEINNGVPTRFVGYHDELTFLSDFPQVLIDGGYNENDVNNALLRYNSLGWQENKNLHANIKTTMNEGNYPIIILLAADTQGNINQVLINKKTVGKFYTGAMQRNGDGSWTDITNQL